MSRCFPILNCDPVVAEQILKNVQSGDLFELSLFSKRTSTLVQNATMRCKQPSYLDVSLSSSTTVNFCYGNEHIHWRFYGKRDSDGKYLEDLKKLTVKMQAGTLGVVRELVFAKICNGFYGCSSNCIQDVLLFIQHISSLFNSTVQILYLYSTQFSNLKAIQSVEELRTCRKVAIGEGTVSNVEMHQIIEGFESNTVHMGCNLASDFSYNRRISISDFRTIECPWFKGPMLLNLDCSQVIIVNNKVSEEDVNKFLHQWMTSITGCGGIRLMLISRGNPKRESVYQNTDCQPNWDLEKVTQGLSGFQDPLSPRNSNLYRRTIDNKQIKISVDAGRLPYEFFLVIRNTLT